MQSRKELKPIDATEGGIDISVSELQYLNTELPIDVTPIILYKNWEFEGYFMDSEGEVWFDNGEQYRKIRVNAENKVRIWDINHKLHSIGIKGLRREFM